jgi:hypothetical protein
MRTQLNWRFRKPTTVKGKLPKDWVQQGHMMTFRISYLVRTYDIPQSLVINTDQIGIHLVPMAGERTWEKKRSKVLVLLEAMTKGLSLHVFCQLQVALCFLFRLYFWEPPTEYFLKLNVEN